MLRRIMCGLLVTGLLVVPVSLAHAEGKGPCSGWISNITHTMPMDKVVDHTQRTIECAVERFGQGRVSLSTALAIADRESHFDPEAYNPSGCGGVFQQMIRYWNGRRDKYWNPDWYWKLPRVFNMRANVIVSIRMMANTGLGDWS